MSKSETLSHINPDTSTCDNLSENPEEPRHIQMLPKDQLKPDEIEEAADFVINEAFELPFLRSFDEESLKKGVNESYELSDGSSALVRANETPKGRDLWVKTENGVVDVSNKDNLSLVDVRIYDEEGEEIFYEQSKQESLGVALDFLKDVDEKVVADEDMAYDAVEMRAGEEMVLEN